MRLFALILFAFATLCLHASPPVLASSQPDFSAKLLSAAAAGKDSFGRPKVKFSIAVTNNSGQDATLINATIVFVDKLDNTLGLLIWTNSQGIDAGKTKLMEGTFANTRGNDRFERILELDPSLYDVKFDVYAIAYKDGEVVKIKECRGCDF